MPNRTFTLIDDEGIEFPAIETWRDIVTSGLGAAMQTTTPGLSAFEMNGQRLNLQPDGSFIGVNDSKRYRRKEP